MGLGLALAALLMLGALARGVPLPPRLGLADSVVLRWSDGGVAHAALSPDGRWRLPPPPGGVDPAYLAALLAYEDQRFYLHPGVDPLAVLRAVGQNLRAGRVVSGASTLTLQAVRLAEPRPRTLGAKAVEALRALHLEARLSKQDILDAYLRLAPFGGNLEGVETAAWAFFGHDAAHLSPDEIALLVAIPQDPSARAPRPGRAPALRAVRGAVARRLVRAGGLRPAPGESEAALLARIDAAPVPDGPRPLPRRVPHVSAWLAQSHSVVPSSTTLDRGVQALAERVVGGARPSIEVGGIGGVAVVVVEHGSGALRALVGGLDFWSGADGAQIPAFAVPRSPGSALKPFLLGAAIDAGVALPEHLVEDHPRRFGAYAPVNYDGTWDGVVRLDDALARSLNLPFVALLGELGVERFLGLLRGGGVRSLRTEPGHYGLSVAAGGLAMTPLELAGLYTALARDCTGAALHLDPAAARREEARVLGPGAAWLVRRILRWKDRPDLPARRLAGAVPRAIHWKTGTSFGNRDAWAAGSGARYTVVVWAGNLNQTPSARLVGADVAGPLLFDILEGLDDGVRDPGSPPSDLAPVQVCPVSGRTPGPHCPQATGALARIDAVPSGRCSLHDTIEIDIETGLRVGPGCRDGRATVRRPVVVWPDAVARFLTDRHRALPAASPWHPACTAGAAVTPLGVVHPLPGAVALLLPGLPATDQEIPLEADGGAPPHTWFVDGQLVGTVAPGERAWWAPRPGAHEAVVQDARGRTARVGFRVEWRR